MQDVGEGQEEDSGLAQSEGGSAHIVLQLVPSRHRKPIGQAAAEPAAHIPAPSHWSGCFSIPAAQVIPVPHGVVAGFGVDAQVEVPLQVFVLH
jgi:hypothetical protein